MTTISPDTEFGHFQDLLGSLPMLRGFIPICVCFHLNQATTISQVEQALVSAANRLGKTFPFLTGRVVIDGMRYGHSGIPKVVRFSDTIHLTTHDLSEDTSVASGAEMRKADYPESLFDPELLLPSVCFDPYPVDPSLFAPVFMIRANHIRNGLVLTFVGNHQLMDATGLGHFIELYAKALRDETFTEDDIRAVNQPRGNAIPLLGKDYQPGPELDDIIPAEAAADFRDTSSLKAKKLGWYRMTTADLERLKSDASKQDVAPYVSTDDAVSALFWRAVSRARQMRLGKKAKTKFARPVSVRKIFGLKRYSGHMVDTIYTEVEDVYNIRLGTVAGLLRQDLLQEDRIKYHVQALATMCSRLDDRSKLVYGADGDLDRDVLMSSWTNMGTCAYPYGDILGIPEATRCLWKEFKVPMIVVLPRDKDGSMILVVCFAAEEMHRMFEDEDLLAYGKWMH